METDTNRIRSIAAKFTTQADIYTGLTARPPARLPDNIVIFCRDHLRARDFAGTVHHRYVLIVFLKTPGTVFIQGKRFAAEERQAVLVRPFEQHYYALPRKPVVWLFITFELPEHQPVSFNRRVNVLSAGAMHTLEQLLQSYASGNAVRSGLFLALLLDDIGTENNPLLPAENTPDQQTVEQIHRYIHDRLHTPFKIGDLAGHCHKSASHLRLVFRQIMGTSLGRYIRRIRLDRASYLLRSTRLTISEVAYSCGYTSSAVFCRAFRKHTGLSPGAYRLSSAPNKNPTPAPRKRARRPGSLSKRPEKSDRDND